MAVEITMPRLSDQMEEGTVLRWVKAVGDEVTKGDELVEIETDKATWVVEAEDSGQLLRIIVTEGGVAPVGGVIAFIGELDEPVPDGEPAGAGHGVVPSIGPEAPAAAPAVERPDAPDAATRGNGAQLGRARATPVARRTAVELGVALDRVVGTGPGGRIVRRDVLAEAAKPGAAPAVAGALDKGEGIVLELSATQRTIARRMVESATTIPHFTVGAELDMEAAVGLRADLRELTPDAVPSMNDLVIKAVALALREFPRFNASYVDGRLVQWPRINVGVAVATEEALLVPVVFDADRKSLGQIARETRALVERAHSRALTPPELTEGTFTVSNLGMLGVRTFSAVINPPQVAILAVGEVSLRAVVDDAGAIVARHRMGVTLACDHRILYGADGARFLARVRRLLERPLALTL